MLKQGSKGSQVTELQKLLNNAGYSPGTIDGIFGPKTEAALRAYQKANSLTADGIYGPKTAAALTGSTSAVKSVSEPTNTPSGPRMSLAGSPKLWKVGNKSYIIYETTGSDGSRIRLAWLAPDEDVQSFFGPGQAVIYDQTMSAMPNDVLIWGTTDELANMTDDPITTWRNVLAVESKTQPWLLDSDYQALSLMAVLEGRPLSDSEIKQTSWWQTHNSNERNWMFTFHGDPMTADQAIDDGRIATVQMLNNMGMDNPPANVINFMADAYTKGTWSQAYLQSQMKALSDPYSGIAIDGALKAIVGSTSLDTTRSGEQQVQDLVTRWIGPNFGKWSQSTIAYWAGELRNDPDAELALVETLKNQKAALFPGYHRDATYETIAGPWSNMASNMWGETFDETSRFFHQIVNLNDSVEAGKILTREGLNQGNQKVTSDVATRMSNAFRSV